MVDFVFVGFEWMDFVLEGGIINILVVICDYDIRVVRGVWVVYDIFIFEYVDIKYDDWIEIGGSDGSSVWFKDVFKEIYGMNVLSGCDW